MEFAVISPNILYTPVKDRVKIENMVINLRTVFFAFVGCFAAIDSAPPVKTFLRPYSH
jgi:hypothetical protein